MYEIEKLSAVLRYLKDAFVGKDEIIDLLGISLIAKENLFLLGPPGTAKSAIVRLLSKCIEGGKNFEYLLTRFTEPNEIFGPFDIRKLREGELVTNTENMLPEASMVFLDEIFNANSAILNSLLMALNERIFRRGKETKSIPALMYVGASNALPEDESLNALLDRFLLRVVCDYVKPDLLSEVLIAGWDLESRDHTKRPTVDASEIKILQSKVRTIGLKNIREKYISVIHSLRNVGVKVSDRRAVKLQNLLAASAVICNRSEAILSDLWVLKYIWDTEEQIEIISGIIDNVIKEALDNEKSHPQANFNKSPDPEELAKEVNHLKHKWERDQLSYEDRNIIKDKLRYLQSRADWIVNPAQKNTLRTSIDELWQKILKN